MPPFTTALFGSVEDELEPETSLEPLCPATYRTSDSDISLVAPNDGDFLLSELSVNRLSDVYQHLWFAGLPVPPRPLHHHVVLQREIVVSEKMDMHLVWDDGRMFFKPIPRYLLSPAFWRAYLLCQEGCDCAKSQQQCATKTLRSIALGFLFSYAAILSYESDFVIAKDKGLLPQEGDFPKWTEWRKFVKEILTPTVYRDIHRRFYYGELRLGRLNAIYLFVKFGYYMNQWPTYASFLRDQLGWLTATTIYVVVVLTAMQVGLSTDQLKSDGLFTAASYGFTVFSIIGPLIGIFLILLALAVLVLINWGFARSKTTQRWKHIENKGGMSA